MPNTCLPGYRPFTCTLCIQFTKNELAFSLNTCDSLAGTLLQMIEVEKDVLQRYMEVYSRPLYWTGYKLINETAVVPGTNNGISLVGSPNCSNCCVAWQLDPYGPIALECDKILPAICTISLNCKCFGVLCMCICLPLCVCTCTCMCVHVHVCVYM